MFDEIWLNFRMRRGAKACPCARSFRDSPRHSCRGLLASFPVPCASSGGRLPEALFMVFQLDSKSAKDVLSCVRLMLSVVSPLGAF